MNKIINKKYGWHGNYSSWQEAKNASIGYDSDEIQYSWPLLSGLMFAVAKSGSKLSVLNLFVSSGSIFFQKKNFN